MGFSVDTQWRDIAVWGWFCGGGVCSDERYVMCAIGWDDAWCACASTGAGEVARIHSFLLSFIIHSFIHSREG